MVFDLKQNFHQFWRFAVVGTMGILIDFGIFNLLVWATHTTKGDGLIPINIISFAAAVTNSYIFNKNWSFGDHAFGGHAKKFSTFLAVSVTANLINTTIVRLISTNVQQMPGLSAQEWLNVAKGLATIVSGLWNFFGYKHLVFKK